MDGREFGVSHRFVRLCHTGWCLILVPFYRCGRDLLGFGLCQEIALLEQAVRINWASACRPVDGGGCLDGVQSGLWGWGPWGGSSVCGWAARCSILGEGRGTAFIVHLLTWRGPLERCSSSSVGLSEEGAGTWGVSQWWRTGGVWWQGVCNGGGGALTVVGALDGGGDSFGVKVGSRWGSVLGSLLFI